MFDAYKIRKDFPILDRLIEGKRNTYLDTAASAQKPFVMLEEIRKAYLDEYAPRKLLAFRKSNRKL